MEFFEEVEKISLDENGLKQQLTIERLPTLCKSIETVIADDKDSGVVYCVWGEHEVNREPLKYGVRFSMPKCPNALAWSITIKEHDGNNNAVIHCTTDTTEHDEDFIESIREFVRDCRDGIETSKETC